MQSADDISENDKDEPPACNAGLAVAAKSGFSEGEQKGSLANSRQSQNPRCKVLCIVQKQESSIVSPKDDKDKERPKEHAKNKPKRISTQKYSRDATSKGIQSPTEPILVTENYSLKEKTAINMAHTEENTMNNFGELSTKQNSNDKERCKLTESMDTNFRSQQDKRDASLGSPRCSFNERSEKLCLNEVAAKKGRFRIRSITLRPTWFRQDSSKQEKRERLGVIKEGRTEADTCVEVPLRKAASCDSFMISSPKEDDFECWRNIHKYLETQKKLSRALTKINRLEKQRSKSADEELLSQNTRSLPNALERERSTAKENRECNFERGIEVQSILQESQIQYSNEKPHQTISSLKDYRLSPSESEDPTWKRVATDRPLSGRNPSDSIDQGDEIFYNETTRALGIPENSPSFTTDDDELEGGYVFMLSPIECPGENFPRDFHTKEHHITSLSDKENEGGNSSDSAAKCALKKAILEMEWSEDEWMELTEIVRSKMGHAKCPKKTHAESPPFGRRSSLPGYHTATPNFSYPKGDIRRGMPPYVNLNQQNEEANEQVRQPFLDDLQRLTGRSYGKRPVPTPRSGRPPV